MFIADLLVYGGNGAITLSHRRSFLFVNIFTGWDGGKKKVVFPILVNVTIDSCYGYRFFEPTIILCAISVADLNMINDWC